MASSGKVRFREPELVARVELDSSSLTTSLYSSADEVDEADVAEARLHDTEDTEMEQLLTAPPVAQAAKEGRWLPTDDEAVEDSDLFPDADARHGRGLFFDPAKEPRRPVAWRRWLCYPFAWTFDWMTPAILLGYWRPTRDRHVWEVDAFCRTRKSYDEFMYHFRRLQAKDAPYVVFLSIIKLIFRRMVIAGLLFVGYQSMLVLQPFLLSLLLDFFQDSSQSATTGYLIVLGMCGAIVLGSFGLYNANMISNESGLRVRSALVSAMFSKVLSIRRESHEKFGTGKLAVLMQNDSQRVLDSFRFINFGLYAPVQIIAVITLLWVIAIGPYALIPVGLMGLTVLANLVLTYLMLKSQVRLVRRTDERVKMESEVISGIRIIKKLAWEEGFIDEIRRRRNKEMSEVRTFQFWRAVLLWFMLTLPSATIVITFSIYAAAGNEMTPAVIFPALLLMNLLRFPFAMLPIVINLLVQNAVSMDRVAEYLSYPDAERRLQSADGALRVKNAEFRAVGVDRRAMAAEAKQQRTPPVNSEAVDSVERGPQAESMPPPAFRLSMHARRLAVAVKNAAMKPLRMAFACCTCLPRMVGRNVQSRLLSRGKGSAADDSSSEGPILLTNLNFTLKPGELCMVVGKVGSGKSSLLLGLLNEVNRTQGSVELGGSVAYCAQQAWIVNATVRQNILMASPYDELRYQAVLYATTLDKDLPNLANGDQTMIGERGINLSGGQKQRIAIARAIYQERDTYLFDDPLSAVDVHVGSHLFKHVFTGWLKGKTVILTTNQLQYLPYASRILVLEDQTIREQGSYDQLMMFSGNFSSWMNTFGVSDYAADKAAEAKLKADKAQAEQARGAFANGDTGKEMDGTGDHQYPSGEEEEEEEEEIGPDPVILHYIFHENSRSQLSAAVAQDQKNSSSLGPPKNQRKRSKKASKKKRGKKNAKSSSSAWNRLKRAKHSTERFWARWGWKLYHYARVVAVAVAVPFWWGCVEEYKARKAAPFPPPPPGAPTIPEGSVGLKVWKGYITGGRSLSSRIALVFYVCLLVYVLWVLTQSFLAIWLGVWSADLAGLDSGAYLGVYDAASFLDILFAQGLATFLFAYFGLISAKSLHDLLVTRSIRFPISFFDVTLLGAVLNRFVRDTIMIDLVLPGQFQFFVNSVATIAVVFITMMTAAPWMSSALLLMLVLFLFITFYFEKTFIAFQRMEAESRGPLISHFTETVTAVDSIRAYSLESEFRRDNRHHINFNNRHFYALQAAAQWLGMRLDWLAAVMVAILGFTMVFLRDFVDPGLAGAGLSYALQLPFALNAVSRFRAETQNMLNHVERVMEYFKLPVEAAPHIAGSTPANWPDQGRIEFSKFYFRYRKNMPYVLRGVSFVVEPRMKVGVVGRTGAGKSSLMEALFRVVEATKGCIVIDGLDIAKIGLTDLRSKLAIIPQDPTLFLGTVRSNLDPFGQRTDAEIWHALELCELQPVIARLGLAARSGLDADVSEHGNNFSVGQRQLLCMARALLRRCKILVMDEATASVDLETDLLIQKTVRSQFRDCTVITIAHRLDTIIDADRVLVMEYGRVKEFASPKELLSRQGLFSSMVDDLGLNRSKSLRSIADLHTASAADDVELVDVDSSKNSVVKDVK